MPTAADARMAGTSPARPGTSRLTPVSASRCARTATTTTSAVLFNAYVLPPVAPVRHLPAPAPGPASRVTQKTLRAQLRIRFVKVAEYQARGVVHFHAVIRLDAPGEDYQPPAAAYPLICCATPSTRPPAPSASLIDHDGQAVALGFGPQTDTRRHPGRLSAARQTGHRLNGQAVANYIAKYATKTLAAPGLPSQRLRPRDRPRQPALALLSPLPAAHHHCVAEAHGGTRPTARFRAWAHMLGYGGHFLTK